MIVGMLHLSTWQWRAALKRQSARGQINNTVESSNQKSCSEAEYIILVFATYTTFSADSLKMQKATTGRIPGPARRASVRDANLAALYTILVFATYTTFSADSLKM